MKNLLTFFTISLLIQPSFAASFNINVSIPKMKTAEYHAPYVAIWVENNESKAVEDIAVWHEKNKWLKDLRTWWRRSGRYATIPIDGITGPTRRPGQYTINWNSAELPDGNYAIVFESVREVGGREKIKLPFTLPIKNTITKSAQGKTELGEIRVSIEP